MSDFTWLRHNWEAPVEESLEFFTSIFTARNLTEQRQGNRGKARRTVSFNATIGKGDVPRLLAGLVDRTGDLIEHLDWPNSVRIEGWSAGSALFTFLPRAYKVGVRVVLYGGPGEMWSANVTAKTNTSMKFGGVMPPWVLLGSVIVAPIVVSALDTQMTVVGQTPLVSKIEGRLLEKVDGGRAPMVNDRGTPELIHARSGLEIVTLHPDWSSPVSINTERQGVAVDNKIGTFRNYNAAEFSGLSIDMQLKLFGFSEIDRVRMLHRRLQGARVPAIVPLWSCKLWHDPAYAGPGGTMRILGGDILRALGSAGRFQAHLFAVAQNGEVYCPEIVGVVGDGENAVVTFGADPLPTNWGNLIFIAPAIKARFTSDVLSLSHIIPGCATSALSFTATKKV